MASDVKPTGVRLEELAVEMTLPADHASVLKPLVNHMETI